MAGEKTQEEVTAAIRVAAGKPGERFENLEEKEAGTTETQTEAPASESVETEVPEVEPKVEEPTETEEQVWPEKLAGLSEAERAKAYIEAEKLGTLKAQEAAEAQRSLEAHQQALAAITSGQPQTTTQPALSQEESDNKFNTEFYGNPAKAIRELTEKRFDEQRKEQTQVNYKSQLVAGEMAKQLKGDFESRKGEVADTFAANRWIWDLESPEKAVETAIALTDLNKTRNASAETTELTPEQKAADIQAKKDGGTLQSGGGERGTSSQIDPVLYEHMVKLRMATGKTRKQAEELANKSPKVRKGRK